MTFKNWCDHLILEKHFT